MGSWLIFQHHARFVWTMQGRRKVVAQDDGMSCARVQGWHLGKSGCRKPKSQDEKP